MSIILIVRLLGGGIMKLLIIILFSFIPVNTYSQISGIVIDRNSGYPVRNSNIKRLNQNTGINPTMKENLNLKKT